MHTDRQLPRHLQITWILLLLLAVFPIISVALDLLGDLTTGIPSDHRSTLAALARTTWTALRHGMPGLARYLTTLEIGYAIHELVFGILFIVIAAIPFRRGQWWAWWTCWAVVIADLGYTLTFGLHDSRILLQSLVAAGALVALLLLQLPRFLHGDRSSEQPPAPVSSNSAGAAPVARIPSDT